MNLTDTARLLAGAAGGMIPGSRSRLGLDGAVALVTGAGAGIGLATARELRERGAVVWMVDADRERVVAARELIGGDRAFAAAADVRERAAIEAVVRQILDRHGRLDVVVANAGVAPKTATVRHTDPADFERVIDVNLLGVFHTVAPALDALARRQGHVALVASASVFTATPAAAAYSASKAAVETLGRSLRIEMASHGVTVGIAYFGVVDTDMTRESLDGDPLAAAMGALLPPPLNHRITAEDAAQALVDGIERRAARTIAPASWGLLSLLRGPLTIAGDLLVAHDPRLRRVLDGFERRHEAGEAGRSDVVGGDPASCPVHHAVASHREGEL